MEMSSRPARGGWIEIIEAGMWQKMARSRPARGGWIEMRMVNARNQCLKVPPRTGRVD